MPASLTVVSVSVSMVLFFAFLRIVGRRKMEPDEQGKVTLYVPGAFSILGYLLILLGCFFIAWLFITGEMNVWTVLGSSVFFLLFGLWGRYLLMHVKNYRVRFDEEKLEVSSARKKIKSMQWEEIQTAKFHPVLHTIKFTAHDGEKIRVHCQLTGIDQFLYKLYEKTGLTPATIGIPPGKD